VSTRPTAQRSWSRRIVIGAVVLVALVVGGPFVYIHFIEGKAAAKLSLSASGPGAASVPLDGTWSVSSGSQAGYRVDEVLFGQNNTAVGRTTDVTGSIVIAGTTVASGSFTVDLTTVHSDQRLRDNQFRTRIMDVAKYPDATFRLTRPIDFGTPPANGVAKTVMAEGDLTLRGVTRPVTVTMSARPAAATIQVLGSLPVAFPSWSIPNPSVAGIKTKDDGVIEFLLDLTKGASTPQATAAPTPSTTPAGPSGHVPPTISPTTVPPLGF